MTEAFLDPNGTISNNWDLTPGGGESAHEDVDEGATPDKNDYISKSSDFAGCILEMENWSAATATEIYIKCYAESNSGAEIIRCSYSTDSGVNFSTTKNITTAGFPNADWQETAKWDISESNLDNLQIKLEKIANTNVITCYTVRVRIVYPSGEKVGKMMKINFN